MNSAWPRLTRVLAPAAPAVTLAAAKAHLRVEHAEDDGMIEGLIEAAVATIEGPAGIGIALMTQTWRLSLDGGFMAVPIELPLGPVQAVAAITYVDGDGQEQTLDPALYDLDADSRPARIDRTFGATWPAARRQLSAVKITFTAGYGDTPTAVPADLRAALLLMVGHLYQNREAVSRPMQEMPLGFTAIVERHRVGRFG